MSIKQMAAARRERREQREAFEDALAADGPHTATCRVPGCGRSAYVRGLCGGVGGHYWMRQRLGLGWSKPVRGRDRREVAAVWFGFVVVAVGMVLPAVVSVSHTGQWWTLVPSVVLAVAFLAYVGTYEVRANRRWRQELAARAWRDERAEQWEKRLTRLDEVEPLECEIDGCHEPRMARREVCRYHEAGALCTVGECREPQLVGGLCDDHYEEAWR